MSPVSNTSARRGPGEESNLRNVATERPKPSPMGSRYLSKTALFGPKTVINDVTASSPLGPKSAQKGLDGKARPLFTEVGNPPRSIPKSDWGLVRAWCGSGNPALGTGLLLQSCRQPRIALLNPVVSPGLLYSILSPQQDCPGALPALAWSRSCLSTAL